MDGFQERLRRSIQWRLAWGLSAAIVLMALLAGMVSFYTAYREANELQDDILRQVAELIRQQPASAWAQLDLQAGHGRDPAFESHLVVQALPVTGQAHRAGTLSLPTSLVDGLHSLTLDDNRYRVLVESLADGRRFVVAQETQLRDDIAYNSAALTVLPLLVLVPVLLLVVSLLVRGLMRPVTRLAKEIDGRSDHDLHALLSPHLPTEIRPFVNAINRLLARVAEAMDSQRRFVADAAHELRSPLTALSLQAERLAATELSNEAQERLQVLRQGIERGSNLLEQLLTLARAQAVSHEPGQPVSVQHVYRRVLEALMPLAQARNVDLGMIDGPDAQIHVPELALFTLVRNVVDNAIRYTPEGGLVDLQLHTNVREVVLVIEDNGPGIPVDERERVIDPFYRVLGNEQPGSGLGLSIVATLAQRLGGRLELFDATNYPHGLKVRLTLTRGSASQA
ncbi:MAG: ATP-binding protein [Hydrogenophaga sp.]|uniref:ATP-binding protein n=2 Tax=Hydrogenophaga sp. TaxID=1904254 RepID=UPI0025BF3E2F|nr:ATP-binding protein [Hydrogenophaga sp.]MBU4280866.1 two-component sensor histidine kinase [Gammaproteobacteria bacterium]MBU4324969.1 two-component sensor histidine kinase [Gammaproteobacteria bacterium]MCG2658213.1 ATP-binding protein [Hydrogenophaga sp.]MDP3924786.1 ATP-binding protein [Hydrogenophaga sp.]